jgi:hypothetical protein
MVRFTPRPLSQRGKSRRYPLDRMLGGPQNRSGRRGKEKILALTGFELRRSTSPKPVAIPTTLSRVPGPLLVVSETRAVSQSSRIKVPSVSFLQTNTVVGNVSGISASPL